MITDHICEAYLGGEGQNCTNFATGWTHVTNRNGTLSRIYFCDSCIRDQLHCEPEDILDPLDLEPDNIEPRYLYRLHNPDYLPP